VSSLGVGGTNAHVILEESTRPAQTTDAGTRQLLVISARTPAALERATDRLAAALGTPDAPALDDAAWTLQVGREAMRHRRVIVACAAEEASRTLAARDAQRVFSGEAPERVRSVAFMFAGGGAQYPGMGCGLYEEEPVYRDAIDACLASLGPAHAAEVRPLLLAGGNTAAARVMERPTLGLPALFITQYAQAKLWAARGIEPSALIGHSMGEYTAACLAGVFSLRDALALVTKRAQLFETVEEGAMLSVPLPAAELLGLLESSVSIAAVNAPTLAVASGPVEAIERLKRRLAERGVECSRLRINVAAHSALLEPVLGEFRTFVRSLSLSAPTVPARFQPERRLAHRRRGHRSGILGSAPATDRALRRRREAAGRRWFACAAGGGSGAHPELAGTPAGRCPSGGAPLDAPPRRGTCRRRRHARVPRPAVGLRRGSRLDAAARRPAPPRGAADLSVRT
jgi:acyl transferase domain-containing protein